jgi:hypothetical protein
MANLAVTIDPDVGVASIDEETASRTQSVPPSAKI